MSIQELDAAALYHHCNPEQFNFESTHELERLTEIVGQPRAAEAIRFGTHIHRQGYNIFAFGSPGTGKRSLIRQYLERQAPQENPPDDWCYVHNFKEPSQPRALRLPTGKGGHLREDMEQFIDEIPHTLSNQFESDEYQQRRQQLEQEFAQRKEKSEEEIKERARQRGLAAVTTPQGLFWVPADEEGQPLKPGEISQERDEELRGEAEKLKQEVSHLVQDASRVEREKQRKLKELNREVAAEAIAPLIQELRDSYQDLPKVLDYFEGVKNDVVENSQDLLKMARQQEQEQPQGMQQMAQLLGRPGRGGANSESVLRRYRINLIIANESSGGAPLVDEDHPTYPNVIGRIEQQAQMGALVTDFNLIKPGALHRANGGYLILDVQRLLSQPIYVWDALKRSLQNREIRIESVGQTTGLVSTVSLEPEPIPLDVKVVLVGQPLQYQLLLQIDPDFADLFKVAADFASDMERGEAEQQLYAQMIATIAAGERLHPFDPSAVARIVEQGSRLVGDAKKLSVEMRSLTDLLCEADYWSRDRHSEIVQAEDVQRAIDARIYRLDRLRERLQEQIGRGLLRIDTDGAKVGQVNGLAVVQSGNFMFGRPSRITARIRLGKGEVVDIEREVALGGPIHSKGVLILAGFLTGRYAQDLPLSLSASLVFEQSYAGIGGDSASSAELYALLSAIARVPIQQSFAVTGSVNQRGEIQAIGGVNEKIEGFFDTCRQEGLTGQQGVLIPADNIQNLMLRQDVRDAVQQGQFHIYPIETVDRGIELLTGVSAGEPDERDNYPADTINGKVRDRLRELAERRMEFASRFNGRENE